MNLAATDIAELLASTESALGLVHGEDLFIDFEPKTPDSVVTVFNTPGAARASGVDLLYPSFQVKVRGSRAEDGRPAATALALAIANFLHDRKDDTLNGSRYLGIFLVGEPINVGDDEVNRPQYTINFRTIRTATP